MNKKFLSAILFGALMVTSTGTFVSCKDYDDDIDNLQKQIDANKTAIDQINTLIGSGSVITDVTKTNDGVTVTLSNGKNFDLTNGKNGTDGKPGSVVEIGDNGNWFIDKVDTGKPARGEKGESGSAGASASSIYYAPGTSGDETGFWVKVTIAADGTEKREATTDTWLPEGTITAIADANTVTLFNVGGVEGGKVVLARSNSFLSSLSYMTTNINEDLGKVAFFPVIGYDYASWEKDPIYEHNSSKKATNEDAKYITMYEGWLKMNYKVNPATISKDAFTVLGFDHGKAYTTRALAEDLTVGEWSLDKGTLSVPVKGLQMKHYGDTFDDPLTANGGKGIAQDDKFANQVDELALQVKNNKESAASEGIVTSEYITMKRMVVEQEDVMIGTNAYKDLHRMYPIAWSASDKNQYKSDMAVNLEVEFAQGIDLNNVLKAYAIRINTNTDYTKGTGMETIWKNSGWDENWNHGVSGYKANNSTFQADMSELGFDNLEFSYTIEGYKKAEVDQSEGADYYEEEVMKYLVLNGSKVSFHQENTASIGREPMIKVTLKDKTTGQIIMTKLLKIKVVRNLQNDVLTVPLNHLTDQILPCNDGMKGGATKGTYIEMDKVFNALQMSKEQFVNTYITLTEGWPAWPAKIADVEIVRYEKAGAKGENGIPTGVNALSNDPDHITNMVTVNADRIQYYEDATFLNNRLPLNIEGTALPGYYIVKITYTTKSTEAAYKSVVVYDDFRIDYPETSLTYNPVMWNGTENMLVYGHATEGDYTNPLVMEGYLENGFTKYNAAAGCPIAESTLHFELVDPIKNGYWITDAEGKVITKIIDIIQTKDATGAIKHQIKLNSEWNGETPFTVGNFTYANWVNKNIKVRAYSIFNNILDCPNHTATEPNCGTEVAHRADCVNNATNTAIFNVKFVDPVSFDNYINNDWYLIDKAPATADFGYKVPLYRLFRIYDTHKSTTNGIIWEPTQLQGWWHQGTDETVGEGLRDLHNLKISYILDITKNKKLQDAGVLTNVRVDDKVMTDGKVESDGPGILTWVNSGDAVIGDEGQDIVITIRMYYNWAPKNYAEHYVTVKVYKASKPQPDKLPTPSFYKNGTK